MDSSGKFTVFVDDNSHQMEKKVSTEGKSFDTYEEAVTECKRIVDRYLSLLMRTKSDLASADSLYGHYQDFGDDPFVKPAGEPEFSAWKYAKQRCYQLFPETR